MRSCSTLTWIFNIFLVELESLFLEIHCFDCFILYFIAFVFPPLFFNIQGLLAAEAAQTNCSETMQWLLSRQNPDGSFGNLGATIYVLPSLVGALPYDLQEIICPTNNTGTYTAMAMEPGINSCLTVQKPKNGSSTYGNLNLRSSQ